MQKTIPNIWTTMIDMVRGGGTVFTQGGPNNRKNQILTIFKKFTT